MNYTDINNAMNKSSKIYIACHRDLVGSAILNTLLDRDYKNLITRTHLELDLTNTVAVKKFFEEEKPDYVILSAARVGRIETNSTYRTDCMYQNLMIQTNVIQQSFLHGVEKLIFIGSTCIYPNSPQAIREDYLLTNTLEYTKEPYAIAEIVSIQMCENYNLQYGTNFISVIPTNLYGPQDNFELSNSNVLAALIRKIHLAKSLEENDWEAISDDLNRRPINGMDGSQSKKQILQTLKEYGILLKNPNESFSVIGQPVAVEIWGTGKKSQDFLWSDDLAEACVFIMENVNFIDLVPQHCEVRNTQINIGTGREIAIAHLAEIIKIIIKFKGQLYFNSEKPEGTPHNITDITKLKIFGWRYSVELDEGINRLYLWYKSSIYNKFPKLS